MVAILVATLIFLTPVVLADSGEIAVSDADTVWTPDLVVASPDVIDSSDAPPQTISEVYVSDADTVWKGGLSLVSDDVIDASDAPPQTLAEAFISHADTVWSTGLQPSTSPSLAISPKEATITLGETISYTAVATDTHGTSFDVTAQTIFTIETGAGGHWVGNTYTSEFAGEWTVTGTYQGLTDTTTLTVRTEKILPVPYYSQGDTLWCVPASMSMIFKYYDKPIHLWDIAKDWGLKIDKGPSGRGESSKVKEYFKGHGLSTKDIDIDFDAVKDSISDGKPVFLAMHCVNPWDLQHAVVIVGYKELDGTREVYIHDPGGSFVRDKLGLSAPYIRVAVDWQDVERYAGWQSYAISVGGGSSSPPNGTIDFFNPSPSQQVRVQQKQLGALSGYCYSSYNRKAGLIWECSQRYPLVFDSDDKLYLLVMVANHMEHSQPYMFEVAFTKTVDEFHWLTFARQWDMELSGCNTTDIEKNITLGDIIGEYGEYTVTLRLLDSSCAKTYDEIVFPSIGYRPVAPPVTDFTASQTSGSRPLFVSFTDHSTGDINSWLWDFGDGRTSTRQNPSHVYTRPGVYTVKLTVSGPMGEDTEVKENYIEVHSYRR
jgi:hypothetical protein